MRFGHVAAAFLIAAGTAASLAAPASAEPADAQVDKVFAKAIRDARLQIPSSEAIDLAQSTCNVLVNGGSVEAALRHIQTATEWKSVDDISTFGSLAVQGYCPQANPNR